MEYVKLIKIKAMAMISLWMFPSTEIISNMKESQRHLPPPYPRMILTDHIIVLWQVLFTTWQDLSQCTISKYKISVFAIKHFIVSCGLSHFHFEIWLSYLDCVNFNIHFETSRVVCQLCPDNVFKQVSDSVELHDVLWLTLQPKLVKFYEEIAIKVMEVV